MGNSLKISRHPGWHYLFTLPNFCAIGEEEMGGFISRINGNETLSFGFK
jgi:hypothetical protein